MLVTHGKRSLTKHDWDNANLWSQTGRLSERHQWKTGFIDKVLAGIDTHDLNII